MEHYARSIIPVIEYNYENFTALERTIADFFIQNKKKRIFARRLGASVCIGGVTLQVCEEMWIPWL
mgnify:CR=1 FL=1